MARHSSEILALARRGAEHRLNELQAEIVSLIKSFPHLRGFRRGVPYPTELEQRELPHAPKQRRRRRKLSAAGRAAISAAQKKRWAAIKRKQAGKKPGVSTQKS